MDGEGEFDFPVPDERDTTRHVSAWVQDFSKIIELQLALLQRIADSGLCSDAAPSCNLGTFTKLPTKLPDLNGFKEWQWARSKTETSNGDGQDVLPELSSVPKLSQKPSMPLMAVISEEQVNHPMSHQVSDVLDSTASENLRDLRRSIDESFKKPEVLIFMDGLLNPDWVGKLTWDFIVMFLVLADAMILPFQLTFKENATGSDEFDVTWLWLTTIVFAVDIIATFNTACVAPQQPPGTFETNRLQVAKHYLRGWFTMLGAFSRLVPLRLPTPVVFCCCW